MRSLLQAQKPNIDLARLSAAFFALQIETIPFFYNRWKLFETLFQTISNISAYDVSIANSIVISIQHILVRRFDDFPCRIARNKIVIYPTGPRSSIDDGRL